MFFKPHFQRLVIHDVCLEQHNIVGRSLLRDSDEVHRFLHIPRCREYTIIRIRRLRIVLSYQYPSIVTLWTDGRTSWRTISRPTPREPPTTVYVGI